MPPMVIPVIQDTDPANDLRNALLDRDLGVWEKRLAHINKYALGEGKRAVSVDNLVSEEALPTAQMKQGGKPYICRPIAYNTIPNMAGDALFTSENRANYYWKQKKRL